MNSDWHTILDLSPTRTAMTHSSRSNGKKKQTKFPLTLHSSGQYRKKIRGKAHYFGTDPDKALKRWLHEKDDLLAGRLPRPFEGDKCTLRELCNAFLTDRKAKRDAGELAPRSFSDYFECCERLLNGLGKNTIVEEIRPDNLLAYRRKLAKTLSPTSLGNEVNRAKIILRFAFDGGLADTPIRFGSFKAPSKSILRRQRAEAPPKMFERAEILTLIEAADVQLESMILLGINCGFGNGDVGRLPVAKLDLDSGWVDWPRPKTGITRRCPLWPETVKALKAALAVRKRDDDRLVFRTARGNSWFVEDSRSNPLSQKFTKLQKELGIYRSGRAFYALRHTFQTIADETIDGLAVKHIMGHLDSSMSAAYRERFPDKRLLDVSEHVRTWLYEGGVA